MTTSAQPAPLLGAPQIGIAHLATADPRRASFNCHTDEYFLMQYRTAEGYDRGLSAVVGASSWLDYDAVVIYHVDESNSNNNVASAKMLDVEEAVTPNLSDEQAAEPSHLWGRGIKTRFGALSTPNSSPVDSSTFSGVTIEIGDRHSVHTKNGSIRSIDVSVFTSCDP